MRGAVPPHGQHTDCQRARASVLAVFAFCFAAATSAFCQSVDDNIAKKFYPSALDTVWRETNGPLPDVPRYSTPLRVDLDKSGQYNYLAVAYSNGLFAAFRIIKGTTVENATLVTEVKDDPVLGGDGIPVVEAVDIDNDGIPELAVIFRHASWLYKFVNGSLVLFGPTKTTRRGVTTSDLGDIAFFDLDGDGVLELIEFTKLQPWLVFKLDAAGHFVRQPFAAVFVDHFTRADGQPFAVERTFAAASGPNYTLHLVNGDQAKKSIVTSGVVTLNGTTLLGPDDFKKTGVAVSMPVTLADTNTITVEIRSDPVSTLSIVITKP